MSSEPERIVAALNERIVAALNVRRTVRSVPTNRAAPRTAGFQRLPRRARRRRRPQGCGASGGGASGWSW
eukprot:1932818-Prymnesium_polylepis.1